MGGFKGRKLRDQIEAARRANALLRYGYRWLAGWMKCTHPMVWPSISGVLKFGVLVSSLSNASDAVKRQKTHRAGLGNVFGSPSLNPPCYLFTGSVACCGSTPKITIILSNTDESAGTEHHTSNQSFGRELMVQTGYKLGTPARYFTGLPVNEDIGRSRQAVNDDAVGVTDAASILCIITGYIRQWASKSYVDPKRIGIWGWSYGGFMASKVLEVNEGIRSLGISVAPVTSWLMYDSIYTERDHSITKRGGNREVYEFMTEFLVEKWGKGGRRRGW
ncbi:putative dipeptidyl aminopeptidase [Moniliophthora roreri]|nr:putative dipeptidyl aminopeptidase [Moniliophthora roreri]